MRLLLAVSLAAYVLLNLIMNAVIIDLALIDVAGINQASVLAFQRFTQWVTTLGLSLLFLKYYINGLHLPGRVPSWSGLVRAERVTGWRMMVSAAVVAVAFIVLLPAQQAAVRGIIDLTTASMRRDALVFSVANYGVLSGDVTITALEISKADIQTQPERSLFVLLNPLMFLSDGYEVMRDEIDEITETILLNSIARNQRKMQVAFNGAMTASCTGVNRLYRDYSTESDRIARDFRDRSGDARAAAVTRWREEVAPGLFGAGAQIRPQLTRAEFINENAAQEKIRSIVKENIQSVWVPNFLKVFGNRNALEDYFHEKMAEKIIDPCQMDWNRFVSEGLHVELVEDLVTYYVKIVRDDYHRLGTDGDLSALGYGAMAFAVAPTIGVAMTYSVAVIQLLAVLSIVFTYYLPLGRTLKIAVIGSAVFITVILPLAVPAQVEKNPAVSRRFEQIYASGSPGVMFFGTLTRSFIRIEERIYPPANGIACALPIPGLDLICPQEDKK